MDDDGLVINFSFGENPLFAKTAVKGGSWRERRKVQLMHRAGDKVRQRGERGDNPADEQDRATKRPRTEANNGAPSLHQSAYHDRQAGQRTRPAKQANSGPKQVISSLFSFNPQSTIQQEKEDGPSDEKALEPSNAPLTEEQMNFTNLGLSPQLATHLTNKMSISAPTAIQRETISKLVADDTDAFLQAQTGSGKTLAYCLPIVQRLMTLSAQKKENGDGLHRNSGLFAIILTPTRELSKQVSVVLESLLRCAHWLVAGSVIGGEKKSSEKARLRKGVNILVATPGRLADHLDHTTTLDVSQVRWLVLDEGDRLMELGFEDDLRKIVTKLDNRMKKGAEDEEKAIEGLPMKRINILCSATMRMDVQKLGEISLKDAIHIQADASDTRHEDHSIEKAQEAFSAPAQLKQSYIVAPAKLRLVTLQAFLKRSFARKGTTAKAIVFMSCADSVDFHFEVFTRPGSQDATNASSQKIVGQKQDNNMDAPPKANEKRPLKQKNSTPSVSESKTWAPTMDIGLPEDPAYIYRLHGSLPQALRTTTLKSFSQTSSPAILLCTDVASRGLDLPDIDLVIEYDPPFAKEDHLHRIGRTARAGKDGRATIFLMPGCEEGYVDVLKDERKESGAQVAGHTAEEHLRRAFTPSNPAEKSTQPWHEAATSYQLDIERWVLETPKILEAARRGYQSHIRAYATHVAAERGMFDIKELHLGHLAKAYGLRDRPGKINVPGLRSSAGEVKSDRRRAGGGAVGAGNSRGKKAGLPSGAGRDRATSSSSSGTRKAADLDVPAQDGASTSDAARIMRMKAKMALSGADEFNLA